MSDKTILDDAFVENTILKRNVKDLEEQLHASWKRIMELQELLIEEQSKNVVQSKDGNEGTVV